MIKAANKHEPLRLDELQAEVLQTLRGIGPTTREDVLTELRKRRDMGLLGMFSDESLELAWSLLVHVGRIRLEGDVFEWVPLARVASEAEQQQLLFQ